jgi:hypothetical protein
MKHCFAFSSDFLARFLVSFGFLSHVKRLRRHLGNLLFAGRRRQGFAATQSQDVATLRFPTTNIKSDATFGTGSASEHDTYAPLLGALRGSASRDSGSARALRIDRLSRARASDWNARAMLKKVAPPPEGTRERCPATARSARWQVSVSSGRHRCQANQIGSGIAVWTLGLGLTSYFGRAAVGGRVSGFAPLAGRISRAFPSSDRS